MVPRGRVCVLLGLLLLAALSGCLGSDDDPGTGTDGTDGPGATNGPGTDDGNVTGNGDNDTDLAPTASFSTIVNGTTVAFDASASLDPEGLELAYTWDLGDNSSATGVTVVHTYAAAGNYTVTLTVTDAVGQNATSTQAVVIAADGYSVTVASAIAQPNPLVAFLPYASGETLEAYQQACAQPGTMCQTHEFTDVPTTGTSLIFQLAGTGTGDLNLIVFDGTGAKVGSSTAALNVKEKVTLTDAAAQHGTYHAFVYMPAGSNLSYTLDVTLS